MHISEVEKYREEKDHQMRKGHLSHADREHTAFHRYARDMHDKNYHSPETDGIDQNAHGAELL